MKKLMRQVDRFCWNHPRFGIPNLMLLIVIGNAILWVLGMMDHSGSILGFLAFSPRLILRGQIWRLVTFVLVPTGGGFWFLVSMYFYYFIGSTLEREWGAGKFTLHYLCGMVLSVVCGFVIYFALGKQYDVPLTADFINMALFFSFATLYPDNIVLLFFIIPIKMKWLAILDAVLFAVDILGALLRLDFVSALIPVIALLNFLVFFWTDLSEAFGSRRRMARHQNSHQTIQFKSAVKQQQKKESQQGYRHKCCVCGRTDTDYPDLEFRYCSRCAGYHCFCQDHIFNHVHFTE